jgi:hypothetical protein
VELLRAAEMTEAGRYRPGLANALICYPEHAAQRLLQHRNGCAEAGGLLSELRHSDSRPRPGRLAPRGGRPRRTMRSHPVGGVMTPPREQRKAWLAAAGLMRNRQAEPALGAGEHNVCVGRPVVPLPLMIRVLTWTAALAGLFACRWRAAVSAAGVMPATHAGSCSLAAWATAPCRGRSPGLRQGSCCGLPPGGTSPAPRQATDSPVCKPVDDLCKRRGKPVHNVRITLGIPGRSHLWQGHYLG